MGKELNASFYLCHKEIKKDGTAPIMGHITINKQMAQFSAKLSVAISLWDIKVARALGNKQALIDLKPSQI